MSKVLRFTLALIFICFASVSATIINVPVDQATIQQGIDSSSNGDTVLVQPGTYFENINFNGHNIVLASLYLTAEDTSHISQTIIDGDSSGSVVAFVNWEDSNAVITGFTIQNGYAADYGGGIQCWWSDPTISNNTISGNTSFNYGGGIFCWDSNPMISNNIISGNTVVMWEGGGIYCTDNSDPLIINNTISRNSADYGGGIFGNYGSDPLITNNIISGNSAAHGGGIYCIGTNSTISNNIISGNSARGKGGGIFCSYTIVPGNPPISNNTISGNSAGQSGGGIRCPGSNLAITNTIFWGNTALSDPEISYSTSSPVVAYCDVQDGWPGEGNIDCDPLFCDPVEGGFQLVDVSCCLGAGEGGTDIGALGLGCYEMEYFAGDVNIFRGAWPPLVIGNDVTYFVNHFRSLENNPPCNLGGFFASADINGDCQVVGSDVTRLVSYFRGQVFMSYCHDYPPAWRTPDDLPAEAPEGWPNCE
ncbi:MAG: DUF1565 domain-containing protein [candidate division Zixibacteria bacterium]|nr:DUF1565 domain-containing protein [candidate division Zixibacteria bacterium]